MKPIYWVYILVIVGVTIIIDGIYTNKDIKNNFTKEEQALRREIEQPSQYEEDSYKLLVAEMALQKDDYQTAITNYIDVMKSTKDPRIAELAFNCAIRYKDLDKIKEISLLWADIAQNEINPQLIAITLLINSMPEETKTYISRVLSIEPRNADQYLLITYTKLPENDREKLFEILKQMAEIDSDNPYIKITAAQIAAQENEISISERFVESALKLKPELTHAIELKAKLIRYKENKDLPALKYLHEKIIANPKDEELQMFYSNALLDSNKVDEALKYLNRLKESKMYGMEAKFTLGELLIEQQNYSKAYNMLIKVAQDPIYGEIAKYDLGQICEQQNKISKAIEWYSDIKEGDMHIPAVLRATLLLNMKGLYSQALQLIQEANPVTFLEQKQLLLIEVDLLIELKDTDRALKMVNHALSVLPTDVDFLYARSLITNLLNMQEQTEKDLKMILSIEPEHANALNTLGYIISSQPDRSEEALFYLQKALDLYPDNPAFMDSMGWALFKAGRTKDSIVLLEQAYNLSKDGEIAAHLGEVLWSVGKKEQAKKVLNDALKHNANHDIITETLNRLKIRLKNASVQISIQ